MSNVTDISQRRTAIIAGVALLIMAILGFLFNPANLLVSGDAAATANSIRANESFFRISIGGFVVVAILDVIVAWALYVLLKPVNPSISLLAGWFRMVYAAILAISLGSLVSVLPLLNGAEYFAAFGTEQLHVQVMSLLNIFNNGWNIGLVFFGLHLFFLGYLIIKSSYVPKIIGIFLIITSIGYIIDSIGMLLLPAYDLTLVMFTFWGEVVLMGWLLWKGVKGFDKEMIYS